MLLVPEFPVQRLGAVGGLVWAQVSPVEQWEAVEAQASGVAVLVTQGPENWLERWCLSLAASLSLSAWEQWLAP